MQQAIGLAFDRGDHLRMTMSHESNPEPGSEVDVSITFGIDDVCSAGFDPNDGIMAGAGLFFSTLASGSERGAFARCETLHPCAPGLARNGASNRRK